MIKKILLGLMCVNLLMFSGSNALAETVIQENDDFIDARSVNTASMKLGFDISNAGTANITASVWKNGNSENVSMVSDKKSY